MFMNGERVRPHEKYYEYFDRARIWVLRGTVLRRLRNNPDWYTVKWDEKRAPEMIHERFIEPLTDQ
jgi:hypothetical protein